MHPFACSRRAKLKTAKALISILVLVLVSVRENGSPALRTCPSFSSCLSSGTALTPVGKTERGVNFLCNTPRQHATLLIKVQEIIFYCLFHSFKLYRVTCTFSCYAFILLGEKVAYIMYINRSLTIALAKCAGKHNFLLCVVATSTLKMNYCVECSAGPATRSWTNGCERAFWKVTRGIWLFKGDIRRKIYFILK